jgi:uncharacterized protein YaiE (UPF0345 family)
MSTRFDHVAINKKANIYYDGKVISYNLLFPNLSQKTVGVILPSIVGFDTHAPEIIEIVAGKCKVRLSETEPWINFEAGQRFHVERESHFDLEALEPVHYVRHFVND